MMRGGDAGERMRGGAYFKARLTSREPRDAGEIPRKWLVEGPRVVESTLHSVKRMVSKSEASRACQEGMGGEDERRCVRIRS